MSLLSLKDIGKSFGAKTILSEAGFSLNPGERAGLIGANGSGKTTLLEIIGGRMKPDSGQRVATRGISIGYLEQEAGKGSGTVHEEMLSSRPEVLELKKRLESAAGKVSSNKGDGYEKAIEEYGRMLEEFEKAGGYAYDNAVTGALIGLGFVRKDFGREVATLSGGERTRLFLAKLLLAGHDLLLLDEPTNHLDIVSIVWLEEFLNQYKGAVLLVSHDRYFLDKVVTRILELRSGMIEEYAGNYSAYKEEKQRRTEERLKHFELASARLEKEKEYIDRMRAGVNARQAKGREKRLKRFELPGRPIGKTKSLQLKWDGVARSSETVLKAEGVSKCFDGKEVLKDVSLSIRRGERVGLVGRNGSGKSTFLKAILGELSPDAGTITLGRKVEPAYYAQGLEGLGETSTVLEELWSAAPMATEQQVRDTLGVFLFSGDDALKKVGYLSGGEKGRLTLAKLLMRGANFLVLDEPTNHLDIPSREALEEALSGFEGSVFVVSHDRYFLDGFVDKIFELGSGRLTEYWGNYTYYCGKKASEAAETVRLQTEGRLSWEQRKQFQALEKRKERELLRKTGRIKNIESDIEELERRLKETEERLSDPEVCLNYNMVMELTKCYNDMRAQRDELYGLLEKEIL